VLLGPNGSGKTTLLNLLFGYEWPTHGSISLFGETLGEVPMFPLQNRIGILQSNHQNQLLQKNLTVLEILVTGLKSTLGLYAEITSEERDFAEQKLTLLGMLNKKDQLYQELSSGEKRKVLLLRSLGYGRELLPLDEPAENLDFHGRVQLYESLQTLSNPNLTQVLVTHRFEEIPANCTHAILLKRGRILAKGALDEILKEELLSELYELPVRIVREDNQYWMRKK